MTNGLTEKFRGKSVFITGAGGFIASRLIDALMNCQCEIHGLFYSPAPKNADVFQQTQESRIIRPGKLYRHKGDIMNKKGMRKIILETRPDFIFHLAAITEKGEDPDLINRTMDTNFGGTFNLLQALSGIKFAKLVFLGSGEEYGDNRAPFNEQQAVRPLSPYSLSKAAAEDICFAFSKAFGYPLVILRPSVVYGPGQKSRMFIPSLLDALTKNQPFRMTKGDQKRDFVYIDDLIEAILAAAIKPVTGERINIGSGKSYSLKRAAAIAQKISGSKSSISFDLPYRQTEIMNYLFDISKAAKLLGWRPRYSLEKGLKKIIKGEKIHGRTVVRLS